MDADGDFVVAWHAEVAGSSEIRARGFAPSGEAQGGELEVNAIRAGTQKSAAVAMGAHGDFVVTWHGDATGGWEIGARRYRGPQR